MNIRSRKNLIPDRQGMTLVELMVGVTLFAVILGAVMMFLVQSRRSYDDTRDRVQYQQGLRAVISMMTREIRTAGCDPEQVGFDEIAVAASGALQCRADLNGDSDTNDNSPDETVSYTYNPGAQELSRNDGVNNMVILRDLTNVQFRYFDTNGNELLNVPLNAVDRDLVRSVEVMIAGETESGEAVDLTSRVAMRNI
ncbi:MAG: prepilin-type N-terminal cleavage/methylation domain-containing protein [bacterium]|nr:prepilin-type N-terminal cleavage/methylation domain-containing protein [bacterium]